ncbi:MAB_1171c family putative transporter [Kitasatospora sp. CM 4170]|uniref:MAB_1171c family putative transporter n=1 Tax=Kitasatospora aburaviensis TaxID=67265 RepID=A0ABW1EWS9_9ACTN|nr:MAB_1171c family putative transporter [Kitasatospora sp. CM 4170]WNM46740.1 MAB_1171c family putative transporter [Kitasatospora sp. CM 4170]
MNTTRTLCFVIAALSSYAALAYRLGQVRRSWRDAGYRVLVITLLLQCLTFTMGAVAMGSGSFLGVGNLAILLMHLSAVAYCVCAQIILLGWAETVAEEAARKTRYWVITGIALNVLLVVLFLVADGTRRPATDFNTGSGQPLVLTYLLVFIVSQAVPCVTIFLQCGPYARMTDNASLRQALQTLSVATVILFLYCTARTVNILTSAAGVDIGVWQLASNVFSALGIVTLSLGLTITSWGASAAKLLEWARSYRSYRALYPLWRDLYESSPDIALEPPRPGASVSDLNYRLHRRVVEIRDGWRELRPYIDRAAGGADRSGAGTTEEARQALAEAAQIRQALRAKSTGTIPADNKDAGDFEDRDTVSFTAEVAWLTKVASAYSRLRTAER